MRILLLIFVVSLLPISSFGQEHITKLEYGISLGPIEWSHFRSCDPDNTFSNNLLKSTSLYPVVDLVLKYNVKGRYNLALDISNMKKINETSGGIPYSLTYFTASPLVGISVDKNEKHLLSLGPYLGYLWSAAKGDYKIDNDDINSLEYGIELMFNTFDRKSSKRNIFGFQTVKLQVGFNDILFFKTMSVSASVLGYRY